MGDEELMNTVPTNPDPGCTGDVLYECIEYAVLYDCIEYDEPSCVQASQCYDPDFFEEIDSDQLFSCLEEVADPVEEVENFTACMVDVCSTSSGATASIGMAVITVLAMAAW